MKKNRAYLKPYIRKAKKKDFNGKHLDSIYMCMQAAIYEDMPKCYVLVQRGSNRIVAFGASKDEVKKSLLACRGKHRNKKFNNWKKAVKKHAQEH